MRKVLLVYIILSCIASTTRADHITGGELYYTLKSVSGNQFTYSVTVKMYMDCNSYREFYNPAYVAVFDKKTNARIRDILVTLTSIEETELTDNEDCIANPPRVCHRIGYYKFDLTLPASINGYILTTEVFFRIYNMSNLTPNYGNLGATYTTEIPGTFVLPTGPSNNSARFVGNDLVIVCAGNPFSYSFAAEDKDGDQLFYSLCDAFRSDNFMFGIDIVPPMEPPYNPVPYGQGYTSYRPLGNDVTINEQTGLISGIAPPPGTYVITVCVEERRNGKVIAVQRKDLQIKVASCSFQLAQLEDGYSLCGTSTTLNLENLSISEVVESYNWRITNSNGAEVFSTTDPTINYTFTDTGLFRVRLDVNKNARCADSAESLVRVYPGFAPNFTYTGSCLNKTTQFMDSTITESGLITSWKWDFTGDGSPESISSQQNPQYTYRSTGLKTVRLQVSNSKGCVDSITKILEIFDKPPLQLAFRDTLICTPDTLQLIATGAGVYSWSPVANMINPDAAQPTVSPAVTTTYYVDLTLDGCQNRDSVTVHVVDHVTLGIMKDTTICSGDSLQLRIASDGLQYSWLPATLLNDASLQQPTAYSGATTTYTVTASIGHCTATEQVQVEAVPYPVAIVGADTAICFGTAAVLHGTTDGSTYTWSPPGGIRDVQALNTITYPATTTTYILTAYDTKGCPKAGTDAITIFVSPKIQASAGHDTSIVVNQPLVLNGSGGVSYQWVPATGLSSDQVPNPIAVFSQPSPDNRYTLLVKDAAGCIDSAVVHIKVYNTLPSVFVPTAFTPNSDGRNDIFKPILAGMQRLDMFAVYNRWGQQVFSTKVPEKGWDGRVSGVVQASGTYIWILKAVDFNGLPYSKQGTVTLIR